MISIKKDRRYIESKHLDSLFEKVQERILNQKKIYKDDLAFRKFNLILNYLISNLEIVLTGNLDDLKNVIIDIETNYYISDSKVKALIRKRKKEGITIASKRLPMFIRNNKLEKYFTQTVIKNYRRIADFERDLKNINKKNCLVYIYKIKQEKKKETITFAEALSEIFDYKDFSEYKEERLNCWDAYKYTEMLNLEVCPYCDRQFIHTIIKKNKKTRAVLDHFYAKSLYPYLSISIFNLIPCCNTCNSSFKKDIDLLSNEVIYPFEEQFHNNVEFKINHKSYLGMIGLGIEFDIDFMITTSDKELMRKINNSIEVFGLRVVYSSHNIYVKNLLRNIYINSSQRIKEISLRYPNLFSSTKEIEEALYLGLSNEKNIGKYILSKLSFDIIKNYKS
ncbi:hypothetical protein [Lysinibacillus sp. fls2-241-R2A-57]|uniref:hypothetical protein n=1 Tax=Lysinibacillus sp. fls2-241-R2A-57 TaxID=3040292 RepID=UPI00255341AB|nr:hypothetical protein [Lysinibacillus sp. fls2-241-R2A-57]